MVVITEVPPTPPRDGNGQQDGSGKSSSNSKLENVLKKLHPAKSSRENTPEPGGSKDSSSRSGGSSRRKPSKTSKVVSTEEDEDVMEVDDKSSDDVPINIDEHGNRVLEDGTLVLEPEPVEDKAPRTKKQKAAATNSYSGELDNIFCTACYKQMNPNISGAVKKHPVLKVLICKKCYQWYASDEIEQDSDGMDEQCRWCGEGGNLLCCDYCHNAFCKGCIKRNLGRAALMEIQEADEDTKWHCFVCNQKPLSKLMKEADRVLEKIERARQKKHRERELEHESREKDKRQKDREKRPKDDKRRDPNKDKETREKQIRSELAALGVKIPNNKPLGSSTPMRNSNSKGDFQIPPELAYDVLDKVLRQAETSFVSMSTLKSDLRKAMKSNNAGLLSKTREDVCCQLQKIMKDYQKTFSEVEDLVSAHESQPDPDLAPPENLFASPIKHEEPTEKPSRTTANGPKAKSAAKKVYEHVKTSESVIDLGSGSDHGTEKSKSKTGSRRTDKSKDESKKATNKSKDKVVSNSVIMLDESLDDDNEAKKDDENDNSESKDSKDMNEENKTGELMMNNKDESDHDEKPEDSGGDEVEEESVTKDEENSSVNRNKLSLKKTGKAVTDSEKNAEAKKRKAESSGSEEETEKKAKKRARDDADGEDITNDGDDITNAESGAGSDALVKPELEETVLVGRRSPVVATISDDEVIQLDTSFEKMETSDNDIKSVKGTDENNEPKDEEEEEEKENSDDDNDDVPLSRRSSRSGGPKIEDTKADKKQLRKRNAKAKEEPTDSTAESEDEKPKRQSSRSKTPKSDEKPQKRSRRQTKDEEDSEPEEKLTRSSRSKTDEVAKEKTTGGSIKRSRTDIESQRQLHLELLEDTSDENEEGGDGQDDSDSDVLESTTSNEDEPSEKSSGDEYRPDKGDKRQARKDKKDEKTLRVEAYKEARENKRRKAKDGEISDDAEDSDDQKLKNKSQSYRNRNKRGSAKLKKKDTKKGKAEKNAKKKKGKGNDEDEDDTDTEIKAEKNAKKKKKKGKGNSDDEDDTDVEIKAEKNAKKKKKGKGNSDDEDDTDVEIKAEKNAKKKKKKSKGNSDDEDDTDAEIKAEKNAKKKKKKSKGNSDDEDDTDVEIDKLAEMPKARGKASKKSKAAKKEVSDEEEEDEVEEEKSAKKKKGKAAAKKKKEESDEDEVDEKSAKKKKSTKVKEEEEDEEDEKAKKGKKTKDKKKKKSNKDSDDEDSESDLDAEIDKLAEMPKARGRGSKKAPKEEVDSEADEDEEEEEEAEDKSLKKKKGKKEVKSEDTEEDVKPKGKKGKDAKGKDAKEDKASGKKSKEGARKKLLDDLGSGSSSGEEEQDEEKEDTDKEEDMDIEAKKAADADASADEKRKALLADNTDTEDEDDNEDMSDFETSKKASKKGGGGGGGSRGKKKQFDDEDEDDDDDPIMDLSSDDSLISPAAKRALKKNRLLREKLSGDSTNEEDSDSEDDSDKKKKKKNVSKRKAAKKDDASTDSEGSDIDTKKKKGKGKGRGRKKKVKNSSSDFETDSEREERKKQKAAEKKKKRKRVKQLTDSSNEDQKGKNSGTDENQEDLSDQDKTPGGRKKIRKILKEKKFSEETKTAAQEEEERRRRIKDNQKRYNQVDEENEEAGVKCPITTKLVLEVDSDDEPVIEVDRRIIRLLKPHQVEAVKFLWGCIIEDLKHLKDTPGSGCILAHCMGLGKTLSVISFVHTLLMNDEKTGVKRALVVCPLNTVLNWEYEFQKWVDEDDGIDVYEMASVKTNWARADTLSSWKDGGGIMIMSYEMFRNLTQHRFTKNKKQKAIFTDTLVDPGADIVVCDEGHILKNDASALSKSMNLVKTRRRIVLTGTPLQNNLIEYHCMISFVKPSLLGTRKEFSNAFVNPISNGQHADSTQHDVRVMKRRAHILHEKLDGCVQRRDYSALMKFLPPKHEYVISVKLSAVQIALYRRYLEKGGSVESAKGGRLFADYQQLMRIWTHPWVLKLEEIRQENKRTYDDSEEDSFVDDSSGEDSFIDDSSSNSDSDNSSKKDKKGKKDKDKNKDDDSKEAPRHGRRTRANVEANGNDSDVEIINEWKTKRHDGEEPDNRNGAADDDNTVTRDWWAEFVTEEDKYKMELSGKLVLLAEVLKMSEAIGDKVLVFSQSLLSLDLIEDFLDHWDQTMKEPEKKDDVDEEMDFNKTAPDVPIAGHQGWTHGADYFRMDGSTASHIRQRWVEIFNDPENIQSRLFLISTKAGGLGINMVAANRVIIFDASWNPSHDIQSIFRVFRFGQTKPVYIYRFLAQGTMEEKIYGRQVNKQSLSQRVIDEHQIERHFTHSDLSELYNFQPDERPTTERPKPALPKDLLLAEMLTNQKEWIIGYHEHDSLLENKIEQELSEEERKAAWEEYEQEKKGVRAAVQGPGISPYLQQQYNYQAGMASGAQSQAAYMAQHLPGGPAYLDLARAIYQANPTLSVTEVYSRVHQYIQLQMANRQQQQLYLQQQLQRARQMQTEEAAKLQAIQAEKQRAALQYTQASAQLRPTSQPIPNTAQGISLPNLQSHLTGKK